MKAIMAAALAVLGAAQAQAQTLTRSEVPIRESDLTDGTRRYVIGITVGGTPIVAGLDSGSTGLRILPGALTPGDAVKDGAHDSEAYGAGTRISGNAGHAKLTIGALSAPVTVQLIDKVDCVDGMPHCPASRIALENFGMQGDGLPGEGFRAIIGINMAQAEIDSPLSAIGASRWIIELPRPGDTAPGKLILNPGDAEVAGFRMLPIVAAYNAQKGGMHDSVKGCLVNEDTKAQACGALLLDTGAPGIQVNNSDLRPPVWADGAKAALAFYGKDGLAAAEEVVIGRRNHASHLSFAPHGQGKGVSIAAGLAPYFAFDVLYDPGHGLVGLKPRPAAPGAPAGSLVMP